jgi:hypothetical protein
MAVDSIKRGVLAGAVAGFAYGLFVALVANPLISTLEAHAHEVGGSEHEAAHAVAESTTAVVSVGSGVLWGVLLGGMFGLAYYLFEPGLPGSPDVKPYVLAGAGFLTVSVAPWLVLPPATPGVEPALSTDVRLVVYGGMMLLGALLALGTVFVQRRLRSILGGVRAAVVCLSSLAVVLTVLALGTPTLVSVGADSTALARAFQGSVILSQAVLWLLVAGVFGHLSRGRVNRQAIGSRPTHSGQ